jgi:hypothetical protein
MSQMIANVVFAWLAVNAAIFVALDRAQVDALCQRTIDRFRRAIGEQ